MSRKPDEEGAALVLSVALVAVLLVVAVSVVVVTDLLAARQRAAAAADLAALAGVPGLIADASGACDRAREVARLNGATLRACRVAGADVWVSASSAVHLPLSRLLVGARWPDGGPVVAAHAGRRRSAAASIGAPGQWKADQ